MVLVSNFRTHDMAEWGDHVFGVTGTHVIDAVPALSDVSFEHMTTSLGNLSVNRVDAAAGFRVNKCRRSAHYSFQFVLEGRVDIDSGSGDPINAGPGDVFVVHPDLTTEELWSDKCSQIIVRVAEETVEDSIMEAFGGTRSAVRFKRICRDPGIAMWLDKALSDQAMDMDEVSLLSNGHVAHHFSQSLLMMLLTGLDQVSNPTTRADTDSRMAPYYVKRVERYLRQNYADDISIEQAVEVAGVSARTLFYGFRRWLDTTPMGYLRDLRLRRARAELRKGTIGPGVVSTAALASGFSNFGQFSKLYRARFGETPSATVMRARG